MLSRSFVVVVGVALGVLQASAQTNPPAQPLPFSLSAQSGGTLPPGVALHRFGTTSAAIPTTRTTSPGNADLPYNAASNSGGWRDEGANGIGILASGSNAAGAMVVAIDTTGLSDVHISWRCGTILQQASRDNSVALQYRLGTSGNFTDVGTTSTYSSAGQAAGAFSATFVETLPAAALNQPVVQVRWVYWESSVGLTGSRDRIAIDDIAITSSGSVLTDPQVSGAPAAASPGLPVTLVAQVVPGSNPASTGLVVTGDLSAIGGAAAEAFTAGASHTFTFAATIPAGQPVGSYALPISVQDAQGRSGAGAIQLSVANPWTIIHVNDIHSRLQPHDYDVPEIDDVPVFQQVGGAAYLATKIIELKTLHPDSLVLDAGDISEGGILGDLRGNGGLIDVYTKLDERLESLGGRGIDAVVVGNHDVRLGQMLTNMRNTTAFPFISMNIIELSTGQPYFPEHVIVDVGGTRVGVLGYTTDTSSHLGPDTETVVRVDKCTWDGGSGVISIKQKVATLRAAPHNCDVVVLLAHVGHSRIFSGPDQLVKDNDPLVPPPEVAITGHWHSMTSTVWQPSIVNYKTILAEAASYAQYVGELTLSPTGKYLGSAKHLVDNATITPDTAVQDVIDDLIAEYNATNPTYSLEQIIGYSATDLRLNKNKWWTHNEFPWAGDNAAGAWVADSMQWWIDSQPGLTCDLAMQSGGGVRRDTAAGPITYREIYETYPWPDDNMILMEVKGQEIWSFIQNDFVGTSISQGWKVYADDGIIWKIEKDGVPIDLNGTYSVAISDYMYDHANDKVPGGWSDATPTTIAYSIRQTIIDYTSQFDSPANAMVVPGGRYELDTTLAGRFEAVVTMVNDVEDQPYFEAVFVRLLSATPDTVARRGGYVPADLVNADGSINPAHQFSESMLYRSYLGFPDGLLQPGDKLLISVEGGFHAGNPQLVEQEGIVADGVEFDLRGTDLAAAAPVYHGTIGSFWDEWHENHFVKFQAEKVSNSRVKDRQGFEITVYQPGGYYTKNDLPGNVGDLIEFTGVQTYRYSERRFRCATAAVVAAGGGGALDYAPYSSVTAISPAVVYGPGGSLILEAVAADSTQQTFSNLLATDDTSIQQGNPNATGNTFGGGESSRMYLQSAAPAASSFGNERILTQFDLAALPPGISITSAVLRMFCFQQSATGPLATTAHAMTSDAWDEATATWNLTAGLLGPSLGSSLLYTTGDQWYEWDVTALAQGEAASAGGDNIVSLMVKATSEDATPAQNFVFDTKAWQSGALGPFLAVHYAGAPDTGGAVTQVQFFQRHSVDGSTWGAWTPAGIDSDGAPWQLTFSFPSGYGHYQFYSVATDNTGNVEPAPLLADATVEYREPITATVTLQGLAQIYDGTPRVVTAATVPVGLTVEVTYDGALVPPVNAGSYPIFATVTEPGHVGSTSGTLVVGPAAQTITFGALATRTATDGPFTLTATASSGLPVSFSSSHPTVASVSGNTVTIHGGGSTTITATQSGDSNHQAAAPVQQVQQVSFLWQSISFGPLPNRTFGDAPFQVSATASSGLPVGFSLVSGPATIAGDTITLTGTGTVTVRASQGGDSIYAAATPVDQAFTVNPSGASGGSHPIPGTPKWMIVLAGALLVALGVRALRRPRLQASSRRAR